MKNQCQIFRLTRQSKLLSKGQILPASRDRGLRIGLKHTGSIDHNLLKTCYTEPDSEVKAGITSATDHIRSDETSDAIERHLLKTNRRTTLIGQAGTLPTPANPFPQH